MFHKGRKGATRTRRSEAGELTGDGTLQLSELLDLSIFAPRSFFCFPRRFFSNVAPVNLVAKAPACTGGTP